MHAAVAARSTAKSAAVSLFAQLSKRTEGKAHIAPGVYKLAENCRVGGGGGMQQNDLAVVRAVKHFFYRRIARHLGIIVPVNVCKAPENGAVDVYKRQRQRSHNSRRH